MQIPKSIKVNGYIIKVEIVKNLYRDKGQRGQYDSNIQVIQLDFNNTHQQNEEVLIHELLECIFSLYDYGLEHSFITALGICLHQIIKDNSGIFCDEKNRKKTEKR